MSRDIRTYNQNEDFAQVLQIIEQRRTRAAQAINHESVLTAWEVGAFVSNRIKNAAWGSKVVQQLAEYIHTQNPTLKGWGRMNIYRMVKFYETYSSVQFIKRADSLKLLPSVDNTEIVSIPSRQIVSPEMTQIGESQILAIIRCMIFGFL